MFEDVIEFMIEQPHFRLSEYVNNPYLIQRQVDPGSFVNLQEHDDASMKTSARYIPILPKEICQIPLRPIDDDSLANMNKRSRSKGRFPFHLPSFLNKRKFFSLKSSTPTQTTKTRTGRRFFLSQLLPSTSFFPEGSLSHTHEISVDDPDNNHAITDGGSSKIARQRVKRSTATDAVPLVEFHDALSQSNVSNSENGGNT